ncbi:PAS domain S-box protein [Methylococcaceae bacterium WWC4]|nr:PAS domain S-box protein [Methylococcaceae bacterium WWC4]
MSVTRSLFIRLIWGIILIDILAVSVTALALRHGYTAYRQRAEVATDNLASVIAQTIESTIDQVDLGLQLAAERIEQQLATGHPDSAALSAHMAWLQTKLPWVIGLRATDARGTVVFGTDVPKQSPPSMADRRYFTELRDRPELGLFINQPVMSRINRTWVINFARRLRLPNGDFAGVVFANISLDNFGKMLGRVDVGPHGAINLRDAELRLIARLPFSGDIASLIGQQDISKEFKHQLAKDSRQGTFYSPHSFDGTARIVSFRRVDVYPLYVSVGLAEIDYLAEWRKQVWQIAGLLFLFIAISWIGAWLIIRAWRQQQRIIERLAAEEEKFHIVADYPYDWEYWLSENGTLNYMSPSCKRITGYPPEHFLENPDRLHDVVHADDRDNYHLHRHDAGHARPAELDFRIVRRDGEIRWISHCCQAAFSRDGRYIGHRVSNRDITDRRLFEHEINRLAQAADQNPVGILITERGGTAVYTNAAYTRITGYRFGEIYGKSHRELIASEMTEAEFADSLKTVKAGRLWQAELRNRHKNGELRWEQIIASPIFDSEFKVGNFLYLRTDISEQKTLRQQLQLLNDAMDQVGETVFLMAENAADFLYVNQSATSVLGYSREEMLGHVTVFDIDPDWSPTRLTEFWPRLRNERRIRFETSHLTKDGRTIPVEITANFVEYAGQAYNLAICRDISERQRNEDELRRLNRELQAIGSCNQILLRADTEQTLLDEVCRIVCEQAGYRMAWVGFLMRDAEQTVQPVAWAGAELGYLRNAKLSWGDNERGQGPCGLAVRSGQVVYIEDIAGDPLMATWRQACLRRDYRSCIALPLKDTGNVVFGIVLIYADRVGSITSAEIRLLGELANDLAFGISVLRARSERQQIESKLHDSEERLRLTLEATQIGIWDWDIENDLWYASPAYFTMLGYQPETGPGDRQEWIARLHPDDRARVLGKIESVLIDGFLEYQYEARLRHADGQYRWQQVRGFGIRRDSHGKVTRVLGTRMDIHERKLAEQAMRESEAKYRRIVDTATEGIWVVGPDGLTNFVNGRMAELVGYRAEELNGRPMSDFMPAEDADDHLEKLRRRRAGITENYERRFLTRRGQFIWAQVSAAPIFDDDGVFQGSLAMVTDISERKRNEEELRRYKDHLEDTVLQRTAELLEARDAAEAANKAKSVFLANMSRELRTPLNAILGFSGLMRTDAQLTDNQRDNLDIINRSGAHLLNLINDVLEMAKIEAGHLQVEIAPFDLGGLVRDVTELMQVRAEEKGLRLTLDQSSEFPRYIKSDESRLRQILINLINNAIKFTEQGGVTVRLGVKENARHHLIIEVEDSGAGIAPQDRQRLFEPFVQLADSRLPQSGTGLGLAITRQFVEMLHGRIEVDSQPGKGSLFRIELPVELSDTVDIPSQHADKLGPIVGLEPGQPRYRILIVEDQPENQSLLSRLMHTLDLPVKIAENGKQGVELFETWQPDLIWMDRRMPEMDGIEATLRIRRLPGGDKVKIVAVTASAFKEQQREMLDAGMDDFIRKPYRFEEIYDCLARQLGVKYVYLGAPPRNTPIDNEPDLERLAALPAPLRFNLRAAVESLDAARIAAAIGEIAEVAPDLAQTLSRCADYFEYPTILTALDRCTALIRAPNS